MEFRIMTAAALLMTAPAAAQFQTDLQQAEALYVAGDFEAAQAHLETSISRNPYEGTLWLYLGIVAKRLDDCSQAIDAFTRAIDIGVNGDRNFMAAARTRRAGCLARIGDVEAALDDLATVHLRWGQLDFDDVEADEDFAALIDNAAYLSLRGSIAEQASRVEGWRNDVERFDQLVRHRHPHGAMITARRSWIDAVESLHASAATATDLEMVGGFMRLAALVGDGHTAIYPPVSGELGFHLLPVRVRRFEEGWRITAAHPDHAGVIGARLRAINGVPIERAEQALFAHLHSDNRFTHYWLGEVALQFSELNALISSTDSLNAVVWSVELPDGERRTLTLQSGPLDRDPMSVAAPPHWVDAFADPAPLWLSGPGDTYRIEGLHDGAATYVQLNAVANAHDMEIGEFGARIAREARDSEIIILDLRLNRGGNGYIIEDFMRPLLALPQLHERGRFFVLIGRRTFSAAGELTGTLALETAAVFVGEPTAARPTLFGTDTEFTLPYSGLTGSVSSQFFANGRSSDDARPWFSPDVHAPATWESITQGRDPALEAIFSGLE